MEAFSSKARSIRKKVNPSLKQMAGNASIRVRTHDQNIVPLIICNKIVTCLKINVPFCQIIVPPFQINDPPSQINVPSCQINVPLSNKSPKFLRQNHDPRDIYSQEGHKFVSLFDHVYGPLAVASIQYKYKK